MLLNDLAFRIDHKQRRKGSDSPVVQPYLVGGKRYRIVDAFAGGEVAHSFFVIVIHIEANDLDLILIALLQSDETGDFRAAGAAPGRPEIQKDDLAPRGGQAEVIAVQILDFEFGRRIRVPTE